MLVAFPVLGPAVCVLKEFFKAKVCYAMLCYAMLLCYDVMLG
jgi:hypothetical protein